MPELVARAAAVLAREQPGAEAADGRRGPAGLTDGSRDLLARLAPDGAFLFASGAAREILGRDPERLLGTSALDLCHPAEREALEAALAADRPGVVAHRMSLRHGGWVWIRATTAACRARSASARRWRTARCG